MTGAVAAIAEPPQIEEPTPIKIEDFAGILINLKIMQAVINEVAIVEMIIGKDVAPTAITVLKFRPKPNKITAYCKTFLEVNEINLVREQIPLLRHRRLDIYELTQK